MQPNDTSSEVTRAPIVGAPINWSTQLTEFLAVVSSEEDERTASRVAVERAVEAFAADAAVLLRGTDVVAAAGIPPEGATALALAEIPEDESVRLDVPGLESCSALAVGVGDDPSSTLILARCAGSFALHELHLARGMTRVLGLSLRLFRLAAEERQQRREAETQAELNQRLLESLQERQELLERLARIQRSITHGAVREDVLEAICAGARELLGDDIAGLSLVPPDDPASLEVVAISGDELGDTVGHRTPVPAGIAGPAMADGRLVVVEDYQSWEQALPMFVKRGVCAAMAAPVHEFGQPIGALVVASRQPARRYSSIERDMLIAFADHASLAISDSRSIQALREADAARMQARFRSLVKSSSDMITVIDSAGKIVYVSPSVERTLESPYGGYEGAPLSLLIHPDDRRLAEDFLADVAVDSAPAKPVEWRMRSSEGGWLDVETKATGRLDDPDLQGIVLNSRDMTERKRLEAQLRQSQRLESVGRLAGGIAHDFNNILSVIQGYARFLVDALDENSPLRSDAEEVERAADRAARLTSQLLVFSRHEVVPSTAVDVAGVLEGLSSLLDRSLGEDIQVHIDVLRPVSAVEADPTQVEQVLVNLAVNARDAMPAGGDLHISLANADGDGSAVRLTVRDTGEGMAPGVVERAFEPFYTTKPQGQGTGLGLATVYGIVTQAGGSIEIHSTPGEGTTVEVLLPAARDEPRERPDAAPTNGAFPKGGETILVVEDEAAVRRLTCRILTREGYTVLEAPDGPGALSAWDEHASEIDLVLTDVVMPGMSGKELAEQLGIEPVFMSGYTDDVMLRHGMEGIRFVQKPFDGPTLLSAVRGALDA